MANITKEYLDKKFGAIDKKFDGIDREIKSVKTLINEKFDDLNVRTARAFTGIQVQLNDIQRKLTDADLPRVKKDQKLIKEAIGLTA